MHPMYALTTVTSRSNFCMWQGLLRDQLYILIKTLVFETNLCTFLPCWILVSIASILCQIRHNVLVKSIFINYLLFLSYKQGRKGLNRNMRSIRKNTCVVFVIVVSKRVVSLRVNICVKLFARDMCSRGINFASGQFLPANQSSEHVRHFVITMVIDD